MYHVISDRGLYKAGEDVSIKMFHRNWTSRSFGIDKKQRQVKLRISNPMGDDVYDDVINVSDFGTAHAKLTLERNAEMGTYQMYISHEEKSQHVGTFEVQEFSLPSLKVAIDSKAEKAIQGDQVSFDTSATYYFGGGVAGAQGIYHATFNPKTWQPKKDQWKAFHFDHTFPLELEDFKEPRQQKPVYIKQGEAFRVSQEGQKSIEFNLPEGEIQSNGVLNVDVDFQDDRGKTLSGRSSMNVFASNRLLGIVKDQWVYAKNQPIRPDLILLDLDEKAAEGQRITVDLIQRKHITTATKMPMVSIGMKRKTKISKSIRAALKQK